MGQAAADKTTFVGGIAVDFIGGPLSEQAAKWFLLTAHGIVGKDTKFAELVSVNAAQQNASLGKAAADRGGIALR